ncbi:DUF7919 family protein [Micromonospora narathiwatensis]
MYYPDLSPYGYNRAEGWCSKALNVGWLAAGEEFTSGSVPAGFLSRLRQWW